MADARFDVVVCDSIRTENNGKLLLIGVYANDLIVPLPATLKLSFWVKVSGFDAGEYKLDFSAEVPGPTELSAKGRLSIESSDLPTHLQLPEIPFSFKEPGNLKLFAHVDGGEPILIVDLLIKEAEPQSK